MQWRCRTTQIFLKATRLRGWDLRAHASLCEAKIPSMQCVRFLVLVGH
jgi:hypothetical protein